MADNESVEKRFLLQNKGVLSALREEAPENDENPPPRCAESLFSEIEILRAHQRAHDDLLRDLTYQISQTNVTVFRQRVAANFTSLREGFLALQQERKAERTALEQYQSGQAKQIKDFQRDFVEVLTHVSALEQRMRGLGTSLQKKLYAQDRALFILREVVKRSGIYNHYLSFHTPVAKSLGTGATAVGTANAGVKVDQFLDQVKHSAELQQQMLREAEKRIVQRFDAQENEVSKTSAEMRQQIEQVVADTKQRMQLFEQRLKAVGEALAAQATQTREQLQARLQTAETTADREKTSQNARIIEVQAENSRISAEFTRQAQQIEQARQAAQQCAESLASQMHDVQEAQERVRELADKMEQFMSQSRIQAYYVRVDDVCANQEKILLKLEQQQGTSEQLAQNHAEAVKKLYDAEARLRQTQFDAQQAVARQAQQLQELQLRQQAFQQQISIQAVNELIQQKVDVDTVQFNAAVLQLRQQHRELEEGFAQLREAVALNEQRLKSQNVVQSVVQTRDTAVLSEYGALPLDDLSDIGSAGTRALSDAPPRVPKSGHSTKAREPKTQLLIALNRQIQSAADVQAALRDKVQGQHEKTQKAFEKHAERMQRFERVLANLTNSIKVSEATAQHADEQCNQLSEISAALQTALKNEASQLAETRAKFSVIERSQRDVIRAVEVLTANQEDFCSKQAAKAQENAQETAVRVSGFAQQMCALESDLKVVKKQVAGALAFAGSSSTDKSTLTQQIAQETQKVEQLASEIAEMRQDVIQTSSCATKLRMEFTAFAGTVEACGDQQKLQDACMEQMQQHIANLQNVCIEQQKQIGGLKSALEAQAAEIAVLKRAQKASGRLDVTRAVLETTTQRENAGLSDLREMLKDAREKCFGDNQ